MGNKWKEIISDIKLDQMEFKAWTENDDKITIRILLTDDVIHINGKMIQDLILRANPNFGLKFVQRDKIGFLAEINGNTFDKLFTDEENEWKISCGICNFQVEKVPKIFVVH